MTLASKTCALLTLAFAAFIAIGCCAPHFGPLQVLERLESTPEGWRQQDPPPPDHILQFRIAVKQENAHDFEQHVLAITTPSHSKYGQHMTREELKLAVQPAKEATRAVIRWLEIEGVPIDNIKEYGQWIVVHVSAVEAERILGTKFYHFNNEAAGVKLIRTLHYSVPTNLHQYVHMIQPTTRFGQYRPERSTILEEVELSPHTINVATGAVRGNPGLDVAFCSSTMTPQCLRDLYAIPEIETNGSASR